MHGKRASLIVNLRAGRTVVRVPEMVAVLTAAGWNTDICLKEYSGETLPLAEQAAKDGYDLVIGYGGDGTLNFSPPSRDVHYRGQEKQTRRHRCRLRHDVVGDSERVVR